MFIESVCEMVLETRAVCTSYQLAFPLIIGPSLRALLGTSVHFWAILFRNDHSFTALQLCISLLCLSSACIYLVRAPFGRPIVVPRVLVRPAEPRSWPVGSICAPSSDWWSCGQRGRMYAGARPPRRRHAYIYRSIKVLLAAPLLALLEEIPDLTHLPSLHRPPLDLYCSIGRQSSPTQ